MDIVLFYDLNSQFFSSFCFRLHFFFPNLSFFSKPVLFFLHFAFRSPNEFLTFLEFSFCVYNIRYEEKIYDDSIPNHTDYDYTLYFLKYRCVLYQLFFLL